MSKTQLYIILRCSRAVLFGFLVLSSTYFGTIFLLTPLLPIFFFAPELARKCTDPIIWVWKLYCVAIYEVLFQIKVSIYGEVPSNEASTLMLMNHRTRFDWLYLFSYQVRHGSVRRYTISLKNVLKFLPGIGWAMQLSGYIFLDRKWEEDQKTISRCLTVFKKVKYRPQILLFPEGTDLTKVTKARSDAYAEKMGLPKYQYVLHPRTTGFTHFVKEMKEGDMLDYLLDVTIAYPGNIPQNEMDLVRGNYPSEIHFLIRKYSKTEIPDSKDELDKWCQDRWAEKEETLRNFYEKKSFDEKETKLNSNESLVGALYVYAWVCWTVFQVFIAYILWCHPLLWIYVATCTLMYVCISRYTAGLGLLVARALDA